MSIWAGRKVIGALLSRLAANAIQGFRLPIILEKTMVANLPKNITVGIINVSVAGYKCMKYLS